MRKFFKYFIKPNSKQVKKYYSDWHDKYLKGFGDIFQGFRTKEIHELLNHYIKASGLQDGMRVLDAGCGVGGCGVYFFSKLKNIFFEGITISDKQVEEGRKNILNNKLDHRFVIRPGDFHYLSKYYPKDNFDLILFLESLIHSNRPDKVIGECYKILKKGGTIYIKDLFIGIASTLNEKRQINIAVNNCNKSTSLNAHYLDELLTILRKNNFILIFARQMNNEWDLSIGNKFYADNGVKIYQNQAGPYTGIGPKYLFCYEIKAIKPFI